MSKKPPTASPLRAYLDGLAPSSQITLEEALDIVAKFFEPKADATTFVWEKLRYEDTQKLRAFLMGKYKARTVNKYLAAVRGVLRAAWRLKLISTDNYQHARDVKVASINDLPAGRALQLTELRRLVQAAPEPRDAALIAVLYAGGLRRFEAVKLRVENYNRRTGELTVVGKRNKTRIVTINEGWRRPLEAWLDTYTATSTAPLFHSKRRAIGLSCSAVRDIVETCRLRAGVAPFTSHDMRRTFITDLIAAGVDLVVIKRIVGHEQINTTASYDRRGREAETTAVERLKGLEE